MASSSDVTAGTNGTATQFNNLRKDLVLGLAVAGTETDGATVTIDLSDKTKGKIRTVVIQGNRTLAVSNPTLNQVFVLRITQGTGGSKTISSWFTTINWIGGSEPTLTTTEAKTDTFAFICTGVGPNVFDGYIVGQNI